LTGLIQDLAVGVAGGANGCRRVPLYGSSIDRLSVNFSNTARARPHDLVGQLWGRSTPLKNCKI
jgi:hypothetical protein